MNLLCFTQGFHIFPSSPSAPLPQQYRVLYIEDNPANLRLVEQLLSRRNIELLIAQLPELGISLAMEHSPDLILLDINLPGMNGFEVLQQLRSHPCSVAIPVIGISANAMPEDIEKAKAAGFNNYLTKPLDVPLFYQAIQQQLGPSSDKNET